MYNNTVISGWIVCWILMPIHNLTSGWNHEARLIDLFICLYAYTVSRSTYHHYPIVPSAELRFLLQHIHLSFRICAVVLFVCLYSVTSWNLLWATIHRKIISLVSSPYIYHKLYYIFFWIHFNFLFHRIKYAMAWKPVPKRSSRSRQDAITYTCTLIHALQQ